MLDSQRMLEAFQASIANHEHCSNREERRRGIGYKLKYIAWYLLLMLVSPYKKDDGKTFAACMTPVSERRIREYYKEGHLYKFAKLNASLKSIKNNISVLSGYSLIDRIKIMGQGIMFYFLHRKELKGYLHFTLEYYGIAYFLYSHKFNTYITPGFYDRYCTLFSYLGHSNGAGIIGVQEGAAVNIGVPAKVYCDEMYCFDEFESNILKKFIKNNDCRYVYTGFKSVLSWSYFDRSEKKIMSIASQDWFTSKTIELIEEIMESDIPDSWDVIVLPHYRETEESYKQIREKYPRLIVEHKKRFKNIDLLITFYSTIVYDFWSVDKDLKVFCLRIPGYIPGYYERSNVHVFDASHDLVEAVHHINITEENKND